VQKNTDENFLHHSSSTFFEFSSSLVLEYGRLSPSRIIRNQNILRYCIKVYWHLKYSM